MGLMGLVVDVVEVLGAFISNSSYGDGIVNCSLENGASISATSANVGIPYYPHASCRRDNAAPASNTERCGG